MGAEVTNNNDVKMNRVTQSKLIVRQAARSRGAINVDNGDTGAALPDFNGLLLQVHICGC